MNRQAGLIPRSRDRPIADRAENGGGRAMHEEVQVISGSSYDFRKSRLQCVPCFAFQPSSATTRVVLVSHCNVIFSGHVLRAVPSDKISGLILRRFFEQCPHVPTDP
eukprot:s665_g13.t1